MGFSKFAMQTVAGITFSFFLQNANSAEFTKKAILTTSVEHDSNPALSDGNEEPVWVYSLIPQLQADVTSELNRWYIDASLFIQRYSNDKVLVDREDPKLLIGWDRSYESGFFGLKANYQENTSRTAELTSTGVFNDKNGTQRTKSLEARWQHEINPRLAILNEGIYGVYRFSDAGGLASYDVSELRSTLTFANTEKLNTYALLGYLHYRPESTLDNTNFFRVDLGADYQLSQALNIGVRGGAYKVAGQQDDTGWEAGIKAKYDYNDRMTYLGELSRSLGAGGIGGFQKSDSLKVSWNYTISDNDVMGADYGINKSKEDSQINVVAVDYQQLGIFYERRLSNHWQARLTASHKQIESQDVDARANVIGVAVIYDTLSF